MAIAKLDSIQKQYVRLVSIFIIYLVVCSLSLVLFCISALTGFNEDSMRFPVFVLRSLQMIALILLLILYSIWLYAFHRKLRSFENDYAISPGYALARFLIPGYNLWGTWNLHKTYYLSLLTQEGKNREFGNMLRVLLPLFYVAVLLGRGLRILIMLKTLNLTSYDIFYLLSMTIYILMLIIWLEMIKLMQCSMTNRQKKN